MNIVLCPRAEVAVLVDDLRVDEQRVLAVIVLRQANGISGAGSTDDLLLHNLASLARHRLHLTRLVRDTPRYMILMVILFTAYPLTLSIDKELNLIGVVVVAPHIHRLTFRPVPVGEEMEHRLMGPFTLIHVIAVLREPREINDPEIAAPGGEAVWCRLTNIIPASPDELSGTPRCVLHHIPHLFMSGTPRHPAVVIGGAHHRRIRERLVPSLRHNEERVGRHAVITPRGQCRDTFCEEERLAGEVFRHVLHVLMMIVVPDDVEGSTLEEVVVRARLITCSGNIIMLGIIAQRQIFPDDLGEMLREECIRRQALAVGQCRGVVPGIEDEVSLLERQPISAGRRPLLKHLIADAPYQDRRMVTVATHHVGEITLMPCVEEAGIVVLRLPLVPHVETLVHDDETHRIAHVEQFRSRRIVTATDSIDTHLFQFQELATQRILIDCCTKTTKVVMVADAIEFHVLSIEPEAGLGIETIRAEARRRRHLVYGFVIYNNLALHGIDIR